MRKKDVSKLRVGQCGGCSLRMRFWGIDEARLTCPYCGCEHEVEVGEMLNLTTGVKREVAMLIPVEQVEERKLF